MIGKMTWLALGMALMVMTGCKSTYEKQGDALLEANDPKQALQRYKLVEEKGNGSEEFQENYTKAYILSMKQTGQKDPAMEIIDDMQKKIEVLLENGASPENVKLYAEVLYDIGQKRIAMETPYEVERGLKFLRMAEELEHQPEGLAEKINQTQSQYVENKLEEVRTHLEQAKNGDPIQGIVADYKLNQLAILVGEDDEKMQELWSEVRQKNLATYLMYDNSIVSSAITGNIDSRINKYGVLLGITKFEPKNNKVYMEVKAYNGSSNPVSLESEKFELVDSQGNEHKPAKVRNFPKKEKEKLLTMGGESPVMGITFNLPAEAEPSRLVFESEAGISEKFLP